MDDAQYIVDHQTLTDAFEAHAWSSPEQMADMLIDGLEQIGVAAFCPTATDIALALPRDYKTMTRPRLAEALYAMNAALAAAAPPPGAALLDEDRLTRALRVVTRGTWSTPTRKNPDAQRAQDERWLSDTARAIARAYAEDQDRAAADALARVSGGRL